MSANQGATVSLLMIVRNEEQQLADCLAPVASLFDEIVIVDTGSSDATREIAARFTPHVFDFPWCDDFSAARNEALRRSSGQWIFWLDADDRIDEQNVERLRSLLAQLDARPRAFFMNTVCTSQFACDGVNLITHPRLFRRHHDLCWNGRVHEQLRPQPIALGYEQLWSDVQIRHVGYQDATVVQRKLNRDVRLLRMDFAVDPDNASMALHLGMAYFHLGRFVEAREVLERLLVATTRPADYLQQAYCVLASIFMQEGNWHAALAALDQGLRMFPVGEYLQYLSAECLYELDLFEEAKVLLARIIQQPGQQQYYGGLPGEIREKLAPRKLADVMRLQRNYAAAESILRRVLEQFPNDTHSWHMLGRVYLDWRRGEQLLGTVHRLGLCPQGDIFAGLLLAMWYLQEGKLSAAGDAIERVISLAPQLPMARLLRAEWLTRQSAPIAERIQACRDILRLLPGHVDARRMLQALEAAEHAAQSAAQSKKASSVVVGVGLPPALAAT